MNDDARYLCYVFAQQSMFGEVLLRVKTCNVMLMRFVDNDKIVGSQDKILGFEIWSHQV